MANKKKIIIVGAGPGGLAAGMILAHRGYDVEILEKSNTPGGRNSGLQLGEYRFDIGPTFFMMDFVLRDIFKMIGRDLDDYVKVHRLSPMYRLMLDDKSINVYEEDDKMEKELAKNFPGEETNLSKFNQKEKKRFLKLFPILSKDNNNILNALHPRFLSALGSFSIGRSLFDVLGKYFRNEHARLCFTFQSKYLGMSPWECPGAFALVPFVEQEFGIFHIQGGLNEVSKAMARVFVEKGGKIRYGSYVKEVITDKKKATGVRLADGTEINADKIIMNADFAYAMNNLMKETGLKKYSTENLSRKDYSCSIFLLYLGVNKKYDLPHHTISFAKDYKKNVEDVFAGRLTDKDFSVYVCNQSATDPTVAPEGKSALYVLVPVPNNKSGVNWSQMTNTVREQTLDILEKRFGMKDVRENIEAEKIINPADWEKDFNVQYGAVFNLSHKLSQMLWFRPHNEFEEVKNIYLVGGGTHPGSGLPTIYQSGKIAADLIEKESDK